MPSSDADQAPGAVSRWLPPEGSAPTSRWLLQEALAHGEGNPHLPTGWATLGAAFRHDVRRLALTRLDDRRTGRISAADAVNALMEIIRERAEEGPEQEAVAARVVALTVAELEGDTIRTVILGAAARQPLLVPAGGLVPRLSPFEALKELYGKPNLATAPSALRAPWGVSSFAIFRPPSERAHLELELVAGWDELDAIERTTKTACVVPSCASSLRTAVPKLRDGEHVFFGLGPEDPLRVLEAARAQLDGALGEGAQIFVLPEVCLDTDEVHSLRASLESRAEHFVAALGSSHELVEGERRNVARLVTSVHQAQQHKIVGVRTKVRSGGREVEAREDIEPVRPRLRIFYGRHWSAAVAICRDFIDVEIGRVLEDLRVSIVLVPACSPTTHDFERGAQQLASNAQAHVLVANMCSDSTEEPAATILGRPLASPEQRLDVVRRNGFTVPGRVVRRLADP